MAKSNPSKQELIQFINDKTSSHIGGVIKIEDLATGVHYLILLNQIHPQTVKMSKVNLKSFHDYDNISNLKLLATYLSALKAPFTFQVNKAAQRNYQENINLMKNMYKYYFSSSQLKKQTLTRNLRSTIGPSLIHDSLKPKVTNKVPPKINKIDKRQKPSLQNEGLKHILKDSRDAAQQLRRIMIIVESPQKTVDKEVKQAAQEKLNKIKKILGLVPESSKKQKSSNKKGKIQSNQNLDISNFSNICSGSKTIVQGQQFDQASTKQLNKKNQTKTFEKQSNDRSLSKNHNSDSRDIKKQFDIEDIKQSALRKYELRRTSQRNKNQRRSQQNVQKWLKQQQQDTKQYQNLLLSPILSQEELNSKNRRKSIIRSSQTSKQLSKEKNEHEQLKRKSVHFQSIRKSQRISQASSKKQMDKSSVKDNIQRVQVIIADIESNRKLRSSKKEEIREIASAKIQIQEKQLSKVKMSSAKEEIKRNSSEKLNKIEQVQIIRYQPIIYPSLEIQTIDPVKEQIQLVEQIKGIGFEKVEIEIDEKII